MGKGCLTPTAALALIQGGTLFEADFSLLDGIKANVILCSQQYLAVPLVMLKLQPDGKLLPMVIQVRGPRISVPQWLALSAQLLTPVLCVPPLLWPWERHERRKWGKEESCRPAQETN